MPAENTQASASSHAARNRHNEKTEKKGGKAGCQGNFHGMRAETIDQWFPEYLLTKGGARKIQAKFWDAFFAAWFKEFQWNLPLDRDPDPTFPPPPEETEEILAQKNEIIKLTKARLKAHMRYRAVAAARKENNPWTGLVKKMKEQIEDAPAPRKMSIWQHYMGKKSEKIQEIFDERWPTLNLPNTDRIKIRGEIARELLEKETDDYRKQLQVEVEAQHEKDVEEYTAATMPPAPEEEDAQERARKNLALVAQPLLELLRQHTGYYFELIAGVPLKEGEKDFDLKVVQAGKAPGGRTWHGVEHAVFAETIMPSFSRFLMTTPEWEERQANLSGSTTTSRAASTAPTDPTIASGDVPTPVGPTKSLKKKSSKSSRKAAQQSPGSLEEHLFETETETEEEEDGDDEESDSDEDDDNEEAQEHATPLITALPNDVDVPTADDLGFNNAMVRKLDAMPEDERRLFLWLHRKNTEYEIQCLNTQAANDELLRSLGVDANFLAPKKQGSKKQGSKKAAKKGAPAPQEAAQPERRSARLNKEAAAPSASSQSPSSVSGSPAEPRAPEVPTTTTTDIATSIAPTPAAAEHAALSSSAAPASGKTTTSSSLARSPEPDSTATPAAPSVPVSDAGVSASSRTSPASSLTTPGASTQVYAGDELGMDVAFDPKVLATLKTNRWSDWGQKAFAHFTEKSYGDDFARAVFRWTALEDRFGWEKSAKGYRAQLRPAAIADWMRLDRRVHAKVPKLPPSGARWTAQVGSGEGPWDDLVQPGQNGMLLVLLSLVWWYGIVEESSRGDWDAAVRDVAWVLDQMVLAQLEVPSKKRKDALPTPAAKRARRT
ncbi:hypothetical protein K466DRAFT_604430 [Polyporus arcularius HHB13444]|uniref:Uncharacterized protein n=1 Tax=Polyporus arcularius HHB13444 TaxID=1314778 RepID=A0A5C3NZQ7_9APHY|nr:hypothetical protein K466DRAFT_604430 [Polyporus arcularius HHB13444]